LQILRFVFRFFPPFFPLRSFSGGQVTRTASSRPVRWFLVQYAGPLADTRASVFFFLFQKRRPTDASLFVSRADLRPQSFFSLGRQVATGLPSPRPGLRGRRFPVLNTTRLTSPSRVIPPSLPHLLAGSFFPPRPGAPFCSEQTNQGNGSVLFFPCQTLPFPPLRSYVHCTSFRRKEVTTLGTKSRRRAVPPPADRAGPRR